MRREYGKAQNHQVGLFGRRNSENTDNGDAFCLAELWNDGTEECRSWRQASISLPASPFPQDCGSVRTLQAKNYHLLAAIGWSAFGYSFQDKVGRSIFVHLCTSTSPPTNPATFPLSTSNLCTHGLAQTALVSLMTLSHKCYHPAAAGTGQMPAFLLGNANTSNSKQRFWMEHKTYQEFLPSGFHDS